MATKIKICGIKTPESLEDCLTAKADFFGLVFYPRSPRHINVEVAGPLTRKAAGRIKAVGLFVDPDDALLNSILPHIALDMIQLHGNESPKRVQEIKTHFNKPVIKALRVAAAVDLAPVADFETVADWLLFDAKVDSASPGGTGQSFDWNILSGFKSKRPWMLSGGLTPENVARALSIVSPDAVDVSSGVESAPGQKDSGKIKSFMEALRSA